MNRRAPFDVAVSDHARERARERFPGFKAARIVDEVHAALLDGRMSAHRPAWCVNLTGRNHISLYVWSADRSRVYTLVLDDTTQGESFVVSTTLRGSGG